MVLSAGLASVPRDGSNFDELVRAANRALESAQQGGENRIQRAVIMAEGQNLTPTDLELSTTYAGYEGKGLKEAREALEKDLIQRALDRHKGNITRAAQKLGVSRPTLYELMDKLGIER